MPRSGSTAAARPTGNHREATTAVATAITTAMPAVTRCGRNAGDDELSPSHAQCPQRRRIGADRRSRIGPSAWPTNATPASGNDRCQQPQHRALDIGRGGDPPAGHLEVETGTPSATSVLASRRNAPMSRLRIAQLDDGVLGDERCVAVLAHESRRQEGAAGEHVAQWGVNDADDAHRRAERPDGGSPKTSVWRHRREGHSVAPTSIGVPSSKVGTSSDTTTSSAACGSNIRPATTIGRSTVCSQTPSIGTNSTPSGSPSTFPNAKPQRTSCLTSGRCSSLVQSGRQGSLCVANTTASLAFVLRLQPVKRRVGAPRAVEGRRAKTDRETGEHAEHHQRHGTRAGDRSWLHNVARGSRLSWPHLQLFGQCSGKGDGVPAAVVPATPCAGSDSRVLDEHAPQQGPVRVEARSLPGVVLRCLVDAT